jgi:hypothetical protein
MSKPKILYVDTPMINGIGGTHNQLSVLHNCNIIDKAIIDGMLTIMEQSPTLAVSSYAAAGRFFCMTSIDAINQERSMIIMEIGNSESDLNLLLDFMSRKNGKAPQDHRTAVINCFKKEFAPNYENQYYDFEVRVGSPV